MRRKYFRSSPAEVLILAVVALLLPSRVNASGTYRSIFEFDVFVNGGPTNFGVTLDGEGNLFGTTAQGGPGSSNGVVFKLTRQPDGTWTETNLYSFSDSSPESASFPSSGVVFDRDGNIYTTTFLGGVCAQSAPFPDCGTVLKLTPHVDGSWTPSVIHSFSRNEGDAVQTSLVFDAAGNLYGYTETGSGFSGNCCGVVYRLKPNSDGSWSADILYAFKGLKGGNDGATPIGSLVLDSAGNVYGTTRGGGLGCGTVFQLTPNSDDTWSETILHSFCASPSDGRFLSGGLTMDEAGHIYGVTIGGGGATNSTCGLNGCGTVFRLKPNPDGRWSYRRIHSFVGTPGHQPQGGLAVDAAGTLYGTTVLGGFRNNGTIFKLVHNPDDSWTATTLHVFRKKPASRPYSQLVLDESGALYGTTRCCSSGTVKSGVVFKMIQ